MQESYFTPVFVAGALRSGTTMLGLMLKQHPKIQHFGEWDFLFDFFSTSSDEPTPAELRHWLFSNRIYLEKELVWSLEWSNFTEVVHGMIRQKMTAPGLFGANIHRNFEKAAEYFPTAKFIHILRDPRDVARSTIEAGWAGNFYHAVDHWLATETSWNLLTATCKPARCFELKYENLVQEPYSHLEAICAFLGIPMDSTMLEFHKRSTYSPTDASLADQWKRKASLRQIGFVESKASSMMASRGYAICGATQAPGILGRALLAIHNRATRFLFAAKRYGFFLVLSEKASRYLGLTQLHRRVTQNIEHIAVKYRK